MILEISRLLMALCVLCFHKQISDFILKHERRLATLLTQRGVQLPEFPSREFAHDLYFAIGLIVSIGASIQLWMRL